MARILSIAAIVTTLTVVSHTTVAEDVYECMPSGFTIGIPPFHASHDVQARYESIRIHLEPLQNVLAEVLSKSGLFSDVVVLRDLPRPDATDLTLLVSLPLLRELEGSGGPNFEITFSVQLTENLGGRSLFQQTYSRQIRGKYSRAVPQGVGPSIEIEVAFPAIATTITRDLNAVLTKSSDPAISELKQSRTETHGSLAELRILRPIIDGAGTGLGNYGQYVDDNLRERLQRKDCFQLTELTPESALCIEDALAVATAPTFGGLSECVDSTWHGFVLANWVSRVSDSLRVRSVLFAAPEMDVMYDRSFTTITGWRLGNTLEQLAAGIAQASHANPH